MFHAGDWVIYVGKHSYFFNPDRIGDVGRVEYDENPNNTCVEVVWMGLGGAENVTFGVYAANIELLGPKRADEEGEKHDSNSEAAERGSTEAG